jgi:hypothetical protein
MVAACKYISQQSHLPAIHTERKQDSGNLSVPDHARRGHGSGINQANKLILFWFAAAPCCILAIGYRSVHA